MPTNPANAQPWAPSLIVLVACCFLVVAPNTDMRAQLPVESSQQPETPRKEDRIYCTDGTIVEGKILQESFENVRIETKRGTFTYQRLDISRIERAAAKTTPAAPPVPTPYFNINLVLPTGPLNPDNPPRVPAIYAYAANALRQASRPPAATPPAAAKPTALSNPEPETPKSPTRPEF